MKTNKSFTKRLKVTKNGKVISRAKGQNHFNAKESSNQRLKKKRTVAIKLTPKVKGRFMPHT